MAAVAIAAVLAWVSGDGRRALLETAVVALSPPMTGFILLGRLQDGWARAYLAFAWTAAGTMLAASTGGAGSPALAVLLAAPALATALGDRRLVGWSALGALAGIGVAAWLGPEIDPAPLRFSGPAYGVAAIALCGFALFASDQRQAKPEGETSRHIAEAAHELRTPLNHMIGFAEMIERQVFGPNDPRYAEYAGLIRQSGVQLVEHITRRLDLTRIAAGRYDLDIKNVDVRDAIADVARLSEGSASAKRIAIEQRTPQQPLMARVDSGAVRQMLTNLVGNAIKFTPEGGRVRISADADAGWLTLEIEDTGPGVPAAERTRLLEPFSRGSTGAIAEGTGLGLALTRALADLHGGSLRLGASGLGGLRARLRLPVAGPSS